MPPPPPTDRFARRRLDAARAAKLARGRVRSRFSQRRASRGGVATRRGRRDHEDGRASHVSVWSAVRGIIARPVRAASSRGLAPRGVVTRPVRAASSRGCTARRRRDADPPGKPRQRILVRPLRRELHGRVPGPGTLRGRVRRVPAPASRLGRVAAAPRPRRGIVRGGLRRFRRGRADAEIVSPPPQPSQQDPTSSSTTSVVQDATCWGESSTGGPPARTNADSIVSVAENAQHEPHWPWFLTSVTTLGVRRQSTASAFDDGASGGGATARFGFGVRPARPRLYAASCSRSAVACATARLRRRGGAAADPRRRGATADDRGVSTGVRRPRRIENDPKTARADGPRRRRGGAATADDRGGSNSIRFGAATGFH